MGAFGRATGFWEGLTGSSRRLLIAAAAIFVVGILVLMRFSGQESYATLATPSSASEASAITKELETLGVTYRLADEGGTIEVPAGQVDQARIDLSSSGVLGGGATVGLDIFDKSSLGATDFTNRVNLNRAQQGELSRTIGMLDPIESARVTLAMPQERLFTDDQQPTTASVLLNMKLGQTLDGGQVEGITKLVSMSIPGLKADNVTITDSQGNILEGAAVGATGGGAASERIAIESAYERGLQSQLDAALTATLGPGKAVSQVQVALDLDKVTTDSETFDNTSVVPLESETSKESLNSNGGSTGLVTGTSANTPPTSTFPATTAGTGGKTKYTKESENVANGVSRIRSQIEKTPGAVTTQSVSVQVSDAVPAAALATLEETIKGAVGYNADRGDFLSVQSMPFAADGTAVTAAALAATTAKDAAATEEKAGLDVMGLAKTGAALIGLLILVFFARRSLKGRQTDLEKALPGLLKHGPVPVSELTGVTAGDPVRQLEGQRKSPMEEQMEDLAKRKPDDVAQLLRGWLVEGR